MMHRYERPSVGESVISALDCNWITGQNARDLLKVAFVEDRAGQSDAIHAAKGWERKIRLYMLAFPKPGFKAFLDLVWQHRKVRESSRSGGVEREHGELTNHEPGSITTRAARQGKLRSPGGPMLDLSSTPRRI
ncbi:MAG TPA: hypothetical protein VMV10_05980 [Pirellulales bacterium]|nr:hypothetical protein [Pirellulales bacterium]